MFIFTPLNQVLFRVLLKGHKSNLDHAEDEIEVNVEKSGDQVKSARLKLIEAGHPKFNNIFKRLDELILKPILIRDYEERHAHIKTLKKKEEGTVTAKASFFDPIQFLRKAPRKRRHSFDSVMPGRDSQILNMSPDLIPNKVSVMDDLTEPLDSNKQKK